MDEIGLFPLELVLLPGERVPLHIFEPRYRELIGECLAHDAEFGLVLEDEAGTRAIGTTALVTNVLERFDDGRLDIVIEGRERFRIIAETEGRLFRTAQVALVADTDDEPPPAESTACLGAYHRLADAAGTEADVPDEDVEQLSYWIASRVELGNALKQELLELDSERERTRRLTGLLDQTARAVQFSRVASERASSNGRVEPP
jgi:Lon protease-like protein